jgi:hypothetical protein
LNSITHDTQENHVSDANGDFAPGGLRARLERYERSAAGGISSRVDEPAQTPETDPEPPPATEIDDPISPELVLVDPELAARARALLPDPRPFRAPQKVEPLPEPELEFNPEANRVVLGEAPASAEPFPLPQDGRRSTKRRGGLYAFAVIVLVAEVVGVTYGGLLDPFSSRSGNDTVAPIANDSLPAKPPAKKAPPPPAKKAPPPPAKEAPPSAKPPAPTTSPRAFVWAPVRGARSYLVQFYRGGTEIFRARPTEPRVVVPAHWSYKGHRLSLQPGSYRWSVRARLGGPAGQRYGQPIVLSKLVVQRSSSGGGQSTRSP